MTPFLGEQEHKFYVPLPQGLVTDHDPVHARRAQHALAPGEGAELLVHDFRLDAVEVGRLLIESGQEGAFVAHDQPLGDSGGQGENPPPHRAPGHGLPRASTASAAT